MYLWTKMESAERWEPMIRVYCPLKAGSIDGTDTRPHDRAIERAMQAIYRPNKAVQGDPDCTLFVGRLDPTTSERKLEKIFSKYGDIVHLRLVRDIVTGMSKQYAFVEYTKHRYASRAKRDTNHLTVDGHEILVEWECERTLPKWIPRRLGGGFGGKKESGQLRFGGADRPFRRPIILKQDTGRGGHQDRRSDRHDDSQYNRDRGRDRDRDRDRSRDGDRHYDRRRDRARYDREREGDTSSDRRGHRERDTSRQRERDQDRDRTRDRHDDENREKVIHSDRHTDREGHRRSETRDQEPLIKTEGSTDVGVPTSSSQSYVCTINIKQEKL